MKRKRKEEPVDLLRGWAAGWRRSQFKKVKDLPEFHGVVTLARLANMLRFVYSVSVSLPKNPTPETRRQRMNDFYLSGALLVEAERTIQGVGRHFSKQPDYVKLVKAVHSEDFGKVVERFRGLRNQSGFHFDQQPVEPALEKITAEREDFVAFMTAIGGLNKDLYYDLGDRIGLYLIFGGDQFGEWFKEWLHLCGRVTNEVLVAIDEFIAGRIMAWNPELRKTDEEHSPEETAERRRRMATKVTFDVNFLDKFHDATPEEREKILQCVRSGALEFFANYEALREVMGLAQTTRREMIIPFARYILDLVGGNILNLVLDLLESELRGNFELQMETASRAQLRKFLEQAAGGHIPSAAPTIGQAAIDDKKKAKVDYDAMFNAFEARFGVLGDSERRKITFQEVRDGWWNKMGRKTVLRFCTDWGVPDPDGTADRVVADPSKYPHVQTWAHIFTLMLHRYFILRRKREEGDLFDLWQMMYLQDMEVYVTEERKLPDWYEDVFGTSRRVMKWREFAAEKWC